MPLVSTPALVLQALAYSETSKILRVYTPELGLRSLMAKGAQRPRSRFGGVLEPFTEGVASFYLKEGRDLHTLRDFDLTRARQALGRSLVGFAGASLLAEIVLRAATEEPHPEVYAEVVSAMDSVVRAEGDPEREAASLAGAWRLVAHLGFQPQLDACIACLEALPADGPVRFDAVAGGAACTRCRPVGRLLDPATRADVARVLQAPSQPMQGRHSTHRALLRAYLDAQIAHDRPFRSLELFLRAAGGEAP